VQDPDQELLKQSEKWRTENDVENDDDVDEERGGG
jgi:hypothetical protein